MFDRSKTFSAYADYIMEFLIKSIGTAVVMVGNGERKLISDDRFVIMKEISEGVGDVSANSIVFYIFIEY